MRVRIIGLLYRYINHAFVGFKLVFACNIPSRPKFAASLMSVALAGCLSTSTVEHFAEDVRRVELDGDSIYYNGDITSDGVDELLGMAHDSSRLVITSNGGEVRAGLRLGTWVAENKMDVYVPRMCLSSCANYVFPAGLNKVVNHDAVVAWHGGAEEISSDRYVTCADLAGVPEAANCDDNELRKQQAEAVRSIISAERHFFEMIGVDRSITTFGRTAAECAGRASIASVGWTYSLEVLESFGVHNVKILGEDWTPSLSSLSRELCHVDVEPRR